MVVAPAAQLAQQELRAHRSDDDAEGLGARRDDLDGARHSWIGHRPRSLACPPRTLDQVVNASFLAIRANSRCARAL
jgi:hypothetical protein